MGSVGHARQWRTLGCCTAVKVWNMVGRGDVGKTVALQSVRRGCSGEGAPPHPHPCSPPAPRPPCPLPPAPPLPLCRWERFTSAVDKQRSCEAVQLLFPFKEYFADAPQPIFKGTSYEAVSYEEGKEGRRGT